MAKKIDAYDRRKLLELRERGFTDSQLKSKFTIRDDRTLRRHLELAEEEQETRVVKTEILKEAVENHLTELRQVIENWKAGINIAELLPIRIQPTVHPSVMADFESNRLFSNLKSHLRFPSLWRYYSEWKAKYKSYIVDCEQLRKEIEKKATEEIGLPFADGTSQFSHLTSKLMAWILREVEYKLQEKEADKRSREFHWNYYKIAIDNQTVEARYMYVLGAGGGGKLLEIFNEQEKNEFYEKKCRELLYSCLEGRTVANLLTLFNDLRSLEPKIHDFLEEILLRRDYIFNTCALCPGKPRLRR